ncbi:TetR/AcrR family transcriptional regulator, fatty acid metabolism regulator protein [Thermotomaculum hydrothermale]|uniref:TetR/AcrR family transcriptional regulator, fatty acid metabolism regulator protein n=1 Tax=Thermotomaculum hydrothermale TaxID=981385 RepID=A0A7R6PYT8_9BACT|nr:TetR/AcrR family transcriptional regulator [Thermotomaculum hydrothermale]BBB33365.1 TetR/AcrR family transcriptional regulator, fatty acid metabolism regulator protein [Thermotomaculum hydrothermale]
MKLKKEEKKRKIIDAAIKIFARNGYFNSRVSEIAKEAGVADGTIYIYFSSKEELLSAIFDEALQVFVEESKKLLEDIHDPIEKLKKIVFLHLKHLGANRDLAMVFQIEFRHNIVFMERLSKTRLADYFKIIEGVILEGQEKGLFKELNPRFCAKILFGIIDEMVTSWLIANKNYKLEKDADILVNTFVYGIAKK